MKKIILALSVLATFLALFLNIKISQASDFNYGDSELYKSIVKVKVFGVNQDYYLTENGHGSGVIISTDGLVLTNYHVVNIENGYNGEAGDEEVAINICLNLEADKEPACHYQAKIIFQDKEMDISLLKIEPIVGLATQSNFQAITIAGSSPVNSDQVSALGFPAIGGETLTLTQGIVSGQLDKFGKKWIKTDAEISFGNSGGALINSSGELVGISSSVYADKLGSIGYALDVNSIKSWIESNRNKTPQNHLYLNRMQSLVKKQEEINNANSFNWDNLGLSIEKAKEWKFDYSDESSLYIDNPSDFDGGSIIFKFNKFPFAINKLDSNTFLDYLDVDNAGMLEFKNKEKILVSGQEALKINMGVLGEDSKAIIFAKDNFLVYLLYDYGNNNKDKAVLDAIISSISFKQSVSIDPPQYYYADKYHNFSISSGGDWFIKPLNDLSAVFFILNKNSLSYRYDLKIKKQKDIDNADKFIDDIKSQIDRINRMSSIMNLAMKVKNTDNNYFISNELNSVARIEFDVTDAKENLKFKKVSYASFRNDDVYIFSISANVNDADFAQLDKELLTILKTFKYEANAPAVSVNFNNAHDSTNQNTNAQAPTTNTNETVKNDAKKDNELAKRLAGKILLQVEKNGEAWYVDKDSLERFYLKDGSSAYQALRLFGLGISNENINKIPVAVDSRLIVKDSDSDGLDDNLELALGTDPYNPDSDGDSYLDGEEIRHGYNPLGANRLKFDNNLTQKLEGKILLQVEGKGEAWYVHEGKRYYLANGEFAYQAMRFLSIGITNENLAKIGVGSQSSQ